MDEEKELRGNCEISYREIKLGGTEYTIYLDVIIDGAIHRLDADDLLTLKDVCEYHFYLLNHTPNEIRQNKTVKELGAITTPCIGK